MPRETAAHLKRVHGWAAWLGLPACRKLSAVIHPGGHAAAELRRTEIGLEFRGTVEVRRPVAMRHHACAEAEIHSDSRFNQNRPRELGVPSRTIDMVRERVTRKPAVHAVSADIESDFGKAERRVNLCRNGLKCIHGQDATARAQSKNITCSD